MTISSRTPEGDPHKCPVCGAVSAVDPSYPNGDSCCPDCGQFLWWFRDRLSHHTQTTLEQITPETSLTEDIGADSLEVVELVMELEEDFDVTIPRDEAERIETIADAIRYLRRHRKQ